MHLQHSAPAEFVVAAGGFESRFPLLYDDQVFYSKLFLLTAVVPVEGCWSRYRRHEASMTMRAASNRTFRESRRAYLTWLQQYVRRSPARPPPWLRSSGGSFGAADTRWPTTSWTGRSFWPAESGGADRCRPVR